MYRMSVTWDGLNRLAEIAYKDEYYVTGTAAANALKDIRRSHSRANVREAPLNLARTDETLRRGDKVRAIVEGYVGNTPDNAGGGVVEILDNRNPFEGEVVAYVDPTAPFLIEKRPEAPKVGDTITGRQVRETPWRRGTVLRGATNGLSERRFVLHGEGHWLDLNRHGWQYTFEDVEADSQFVVEFAPGK